MPFLNKIKEWIKAHLTEILSMSVYSVLFGYLLFCFLCVISKADEAIDFFVLRLIKCDNSALICMALVFGLLSLVKFVRSVKKNNAKKSFEKSL